MSSPLALRQGWPGCCSNRGECSSLLANKLAASKFPILPVSLGTGAHLLFDSDQRGPICKCFGTSGGPLTLPATSARRWTVASDLQTTRRLCTVASRIEATDVVRGNRTAEA